MAELESTAEKWTFTQFVESQCKQFPELVPLKHLLTGRYPPSTLCLTWTTSQKVDVIVVDVYLQPVPPSFKSIGTISDLQQLTTKDVPDEVKMRLFLVEDMTAPVIEALGSAFCCHPQMFEHHMHTMKFRDETTFDKNGTAIPKGDVEVLLKVMHHGKLRALSERLNLPFFSLPFLRIHEYTPEEELEHVEKKTMNRDLEEAFVTPGFLEERFTGAFYEAYQGLIPRS